MHRTIVCLKAHVGPAPLTLTLKDFCRGYHSFIFQSICAILGAHDKCLPWQEHFNVALTRVMFPLSDACGISVLKQCHILSRPVLIGITFVIWSATAYSPLAYFAASQGRIYLSAQAQRPWRLGTMQGCREEQNNIVKCSERPVDELHVLCNNLVSQCKFTTSIRTALSVSFSTATKSQLTLQGMPFRNRISDLGRGYWDWIRGSSRLQVGVSNFRGLCGIIRPNPAPWQASISEGRPAIRHQSMRMVLVVAPERI